MKDYLAFIFAAVVVLLIYAALGFSLNDSKEIEAWTKACIEKAGVLVNTPDGYVCARLNIVR